MTTPTTNDPQQQPALGKCARCDQPATVAITDAPGNVRCDRHAAAIFQQQPYSVQQQPPSSASEVKVEYTKSGVPKDCPGCGHAFHRAGKCSWGDDDGMCPCPRNMAVHLDIPAPSTGATADGDVETWVGVPAHRPTCRYCCDAYDQVRPEVAQLRSDLASLTRQLAVAEAEIQRHEHYEDTLRADLAHAQAERERLGGHVREAAQALVGEAALHAEIKQLRAQVQAMRPVVEASREVVSAADASEDDGEDEATQDAWHAWDKAVRACYGLALDQAQPQQQQEVPD